SAAPASLEHRAEEDVYLLWRKRGEYKRPKEIVACRASCRKQNAAQPRWGWCHIASSPRVAPRIPPQPRAEGRNPVGIEAGLPSPIPEDPLKFFSSSPDIQDTCLRITL